FSLQANALSVKSCSSSSPFPKHPGTEDCCTKEGLQRKLCLAALHHSLDEFPAYVEPSNEELCQSFKEDPQLFSDMYLYEFSRTYLSAPLGLLVNATNGYLKMIASCCNAKNTNICFLGERLQLKNILLFTRFVHHVCLRYTYYGLETFKARSMIYYCQKMPVANFDEILPAVDHFIQALSKCCSKLDGDCLLKELTAYKEKVCTGTTLPAKQERLAECCKKQTEEALSCMHLMEQADPPELPELQEPSNDQLCTGDQLVISKFVFELSRRNTKLPPVVLTKIYDGFLKMINGCCSAVDSNACFNTKRPQLKREMEQYISKVNEVCLEYKKYDFTDYKKRVAEQFKEKLPTATPEELETRIEERTHFASTCCSQQAPTIYCGKMYSAFFCNVL
uniref:Vitamin D-binding protein n=1 Tax=Latimeria chalumnae TaxID=7897 RepID=H2ZZM2_LATCH